MEIFGNKLPTTTTITTTIYICIYIYIYIGRYDIKLPLYVIELHDT